MPLASGARLGLYEVLGLFGAGGMGDVYKARDTRLDHAVALELHPAHVSTGPARRTRFERAANTIWTLNHPHICTHHDVGERDVARFSGRCRTWRRSNARGSRRMRRPRTSMTGNVRAAGRVQAWVVGSAMNRANHVLQRWGLVVLISCLITTTAWGQVVGPAGNIPLPSEELAQRLGYADFEIVSVKGAGGGIMGAKKLRLRFDDGVEIDVKWKQAPAGAEGWNNSPRREIAAYEVQKLFLEPDEYVVPISVPRCIPLDAYAAVERRTQGNVSEADCVLGLLSVWLQNVVMPKQLFDPGRFQRDGSYARSLGHLNILTYLINHQDGRANNFLISTVEQRPQLFSIDNGLAFSTVFHNYFLPHWNRIRVPSLPGECVARLRAVGREDLDRLAVLAEMRGDEHDVLQNVKASENWNRLTGARLAPGRVQFGLTLSEIDAIEERRAKLLRDVDGGKVAVLRH